MIFKSNNPLIIEVYGKVNGMLKVKSSKEVTPERLYEETNSLVKLSYEEVSASKSTSHNGS